MKKLLFLSMMCIAIGSYAQTAKSVPDEVITNDSTFWSISTLSSVGYVNTTPGANYNTYKNGGGMLVKFNFKKNGRFVFQLYVQANTYSIENETWTEVEGTVEFRKDAKGQNIFITHAEKGIYRITKNGVTSKRAITKAELDNQHSFTMLWERTTFKDDPNNTYLLMVDLKKYPSADISNPSTIKPEWVSKFHIPSKN